MATSGLVFAIHCLDFSKPENTRFQYGSSVLPLSSAAPMAGTCDEPTPAMIFPTAHFRFAEDFFAGDFFAGDFFAGDFFAGDFFAGDFFAEGFDFPFGLAFALTTLSLPDLLRLPSTERPPASIIA